MPVVESPTSTLPLLRLAHVHFDAPTRGLAARQFAGPQTPSTTLSAGPVNLTSGPSVTLFTLIFVLAGLAVVIIAGGSRFFWVRRANASLIDDTNAAAARAGAARWWDVGEGIGAGGDGWGRPSTRKRRVEKVLARPRLGEVELKEGEARLGEVKKSEPLTLTVPKSNRRAPTPRLLLSVLILPPSPPVPVRNRAAESEEEPELPEMEIGTFQIDLALKGDFRSRVQWEQLKSGLREEEDKWNREGG